MDKSTLLQKQEVATAKFTELQKQSEKKRQELQDIEDELKRLQGEYRSYQELIDGLEPATTIKAEPVVSSGSVTPAKKDKNGGK